MIDFGIHYDIPVEVYHSKDCPGVSRSDLNLIAKSPLHYLNKYSKLSEIYGEEEEEESSEEKKEKAALVFGRAFHTLILEPHKFDREFVDAIPDSKRTKEGKAKWEQFIAENKGKSILKRKEMQTLAEMKKSLLRSRTVQELLNYEMGRPEVTAISIDPDTKTPRKTRADFARSDGILIDFKTTSDDATPQSFRLEVVKRSYDKQGAYYLDNFSDASEFCCSGGLIQPIKFNHFIFVVCEKNPPYGIAVYRLDDACIDIGRKLYKRDLRRYEDAFSGDVNDIGKLGYPDMIQSLDMASFGHDYNNRK